MGIYEQYDWEILSPNLASDATACEKCGARKKKVIQYENKGTGCCILSKVTTICENCMHKEIHFGSCGTT